MQVEKLYWNSDSQEVNFTSGHQMLFWLIIVIEKRGNLFGINALG